MTPRSLILVGGHSRRMGRDKATIIRPDGVRQIDYLISLAGHHTAGVTLSTSSPAADFPATASILPDIEPGGGPMAALAALAATQPADTLVIGVDLFLLDGDTLQHLIRHHDPSRRATCFANRIDGRPEPICAIFSALALQQAADDYARGGRHFRHFLESLDPRVLDLPHPAAIDNANTPQELAECFAKLRFGVVAKSIHLLHPPGPLRDARGLDAESLDTLACTLGGLFDEVCFRHHLRIDPGTLQPLLNGLPSTWESQFHDGDTLSFPLYSSYRCP